MLTAFLAVCWIQFIAGELVGCLQAFGIVINCPPVLLGFTLAVVNSLADQATSLSVARVSGKRAAFAACYASMTFNVSLATFCGYLLYVRRTRKRALLVRITQPTWLLWWSLMCMCMALLLVIAASKVRQGEAQLPRMTGQWLRTSFVILLFLFVLQGIWEWGK
jgi:solute carrier family 24 (sodium/potassium/calcium exchanger), member 6